MDFLRGRVALENRWGETRGVSSQQKGESGCLFNKHGDYPTFHDGSNHRPGRFVRLKEAELLEPRRSFLSKNASLCLLKGLKFIFSGFFGG